MLLDYALSIELIAEDLILNATLAEAVLLLHLRIDKRREALVVEGDKVRPWKRGSTYSLADLRLADHDGLDLAIDGEFSERWHYSTSSSSSGSSSSYSSSSSSS